MNFFAYWKSDSLILATMRAKEVSPKQAPTLHRIVERAARDAGLPMPKVYVIDTPAPNAFATGRNPEHAAVAATTGVMSILTERDHPMDDLLDLDSYAESAFITPICLGLSDREAFESRFAQRASEAPQRPVHRYMAHLDEILKIQDHLIEISTTHGIPVITTTTVESLTSEVAMVVSEQLQEQEEIKKALGAARKKRKD